VAFTRVINGEVKGAEDGEELFDAWNDCTDWGYVVALVDQVAVGGADCGVVSIECSL